MMSPFRHAYFRRHFRHYFCHMLTYFRQLLRAPPYFAAVTLFADTLSFRFRYATLFHGAITAMLLIFDCHFHCHYYAIFRCFDYRYAAIMTLSQALIRC